MSEPPAIYNARQFACQICGKTFEPSPPEAEALAELERTFGIQAEKAAGLCQECGRAQDRRIQ
jgi:hypothetical protein